MRPAAKKQAARKKFVWTGSEFAPVEVEQPQDIAAPVQDEDHASPVKIPVPALSISASQESFVPDVRKESSEFRTLDWCLPIEHVAVANVRVQLVATERKESNKKAVLKSMQKYENCPRCVVEVWAEGSVEGQKLAHCRGSLCPKTSHMHVHWLDRMKDAGPNTSRGWRYVSGLDETQTPRVPLTTRGSTSQTLAQACFATLAAIALLFGMVIVDLEAEDNGSGKLVQFYKDLGFKVIPNRWNWIIGGTGMEAPIRDVARLAPQKWLGVMPTAFNPWGWLCEGLSPRRSIRARQQHAFERAEEARRHENMDVAEVAPPDSSISRLDAELLQFEASQEAHIRKFLLRRSGRPEQMPAMTSKRGS